MTTIGKVIQKIGKWMDQKQIKNTEYRNSKQQTEIGDRHTTEKHEV